MLLNLSLLLALLLNKTFGTIYHVNPFNVNFYGNGKTWSEAFVDLDSALNAATKLIDEIWLIGLTNYTYYPNTNDRTDCFIVNKGVSIYGSFQGNETSPSQRLLLTPKSVISGDIGIINDNTDNCFHVIRFKEVLLLDGVILKDGNADFNMNNDYSIQDENALNKYGGGIMNINIFGGRQELILNNVIIRDCNALNGGAIFLFGKDNNILIKESKFIGNKAIQKKYEGGYGGAIYLYYLANITIQDSEFEYNQGMNRGGAIYIDYGGIFQCDRCIFNNNNARNFGGAIFSEDRNSQTIGTFPLIKSSIFANNYANMFGGAICFFNGVDAILKDNIFLSNYVNNIQGSGGAISIINSILNPIESNGNIYSQNYINSINNLDNIYIDNETLFDGYDDSLIFDLDQELNELYSNYIDITPEMMNIDNNNICFVDVNNKIDSNSKDGNTWNTAYNDLQDCIDLLSITSNGGEIWVKSGIYVPSQIPKWKLDIGKTSNIHRSFILSPNIALFGGFIGNETDRSQRNIILHKTYLSCKISDNKYCKQIVNAADNTLIDGFIFKDAGSGVASNKRRLANSLTIDKILSSTAGNSGGGIYSNSTNITIVNSIFLKLFSSGKGAAVYCIGQQGDSSNNITRKSPTFINVAFLGNRANQRGGAISADIECNFKCQYCKFDSNECSRKGGAIYLDFSSNPILENSIFLSNLAMESGGGIAADGKSYVIFNGTTDFIGNMAKMAGGALYSGSGAGLNIKQGFEFQNEPYFKDNGIILNNNQGQSDIYGWPFSIIKNDESSLITTIQPSIAPTINTPTPTTILPDYYSVNKPNFLIYLVDDFLVTQKMKNVSSPKGQHLINKDIEYLDIDLPAIEEIMNSGVIFRRSYTSSPKCSPSRFTLLTGRYPIRNKWAQERTLKTSNGKQGVNITVITSKLGPNNDSIYNVPNLLKTVGNYYTGMVGKWHLMTSDDNGNNFGCSSLSTKPNFSIYNQCTNIVKQQGFDFVDAYYHSNIGINPYFSHSPEWMVSRSQYFIKEAVNKNKPFFLYFSSTLTHDPSTFNALFNYDINDSPKGRLNELKNNESPIDTLMKDRKDIWEKTLSFGYPIGSPKNEFIASMIWMDNSLGSLINYLKLNNLYDNTFIILMNDHGMGSKGMLYEHGTRIMQYVRYPPIFGYKQRIVSNDFITSSSDIAATLFQAAQIKQNDIPKQYKLDSYSWLDAIINNNDDDQDKDKDKDKQFKTRFMDIYNSHAIIGKEWKYLFRATKQVETDGDMYKLFKSSTDSEQFYNIKYDPNEQNNQIYNESIKDILFKYKIKMYDYIYNEACIVNDCILPNISYIPYWSNWTIPTLDPNAMTCQNIINWDYSWRRVTTTSWNESLFLYEAEEILLNKPQYDECGIINQIEYVYKFQQDGRRVDLFMIICCGKEGYNSFGTKYIIPDQYKPNHLMPGFSGYKQHLFNDHNNNKYILGWKEYLVITLLCLIPCCCAIFCIYKLIYIKYKLHKQELMEKALAEKKRKITTNYNKKVPSQSKLSITTSNSRLPSIQNLARSSTRRVTISTKSIDEEISRTGSIRASVIVPTTFDDKQIIRPKPINMTQIRSLSQRSLPSTPSMESQSRSFNSSHRLKKSKSTSYLQDKHERISRSRSVSPRISNQRAIRISKRTPTITPEPPQFFSEYNDNQLPINGPIIGGTLDTIQSQYDMDITTINKDDGFIFNNNYERGEKDQDTVEIVYDE